MTSISDPHAHAALEDELDETNRGRMRWVLLAMLVAHAIHVFAFWVPAAERAALGAEMVQFRAMVVGVHAATGVVAGVLAGLVWFGPLRWMRVLTPLAVLTYLLHGAAIAAADQLNIPSGQITKFQFGPHKKGAHCFNRLQHLLPACGPFA